MIGTVELIIKNIGMLATPQGTTPLQGESQGKISILSKAFIALKGDKIVAIGKEEKLDDLPVDKNYLYRCRRVALSHRAL